MAAGSIASPPRAAAEARGDAPFWLWMNLLSLDAPVVALVWQDFLARCYPSVLHAVGRWVLGLTVWAIYIADRLIDVRGVAAVNESTRHQFYRRNRATAMGLLVAVVLADLWMAAAWLRPVVVVNGVLAGAAVVWYLAVFPMWRMGAVRWKQPCAALLFTVGVFLVAWTGTGAAWRVLAGPAVAFGALCLGNMTLIEGRHGGRVWAGMAVLAAVCAVLPNPRWYAAVAVSAAGLAALDFGGGALSRDARSVLADLVLLTPLLIR